VWPVWPAVIVTPKGSSWEIHGNAREMQHIEWEIPYKWRCLTINGTIIYKWGMFQPCLITGWYRLQLHTVTSCNSHLMIRVFTLRHSQRFRSEPPRERKSPTPFQGPFDNEDRLWWKVMKLDSRRPAFTGQWPDLRYSQIKSFWFNIRTPLWHLFCSFAICFVNIPDVGLLVRFKPHCQHSARSDGQSLRVSHLRRIIFESIPIGLWLFIHCPFQTLCLKNYSQTVSQTSI